LIVLDNCEHVLAEAATAASAIVRSCPGVSVLATSREPLGVSGERVMALQPLDLDDAMSLFASRAADSDGDFVLNGASEAAVATICTNVDRLPLAIELTAARTRAFSAQQLAELLDHRFGLVSAQGGTLAPTVGGCNIVGNAGVGIRNDNPFVALAAQGNWWGDAGGAAGPTGDGVSGDVDVSNPSATSMTLGY